MNVALRRPMTLAEFLLWEDRQELRYEFDGFAPVAMTGGTAAHAALQRNLLFQLTGALLGRPCQPYGSELKIEVAGRIRYPDAFVVCSPVANEAKVVTDPVAIFEVLSDSTAHTDLTIKNAEYRATPSVQHYVLLEQTHAGAVVFSRKGEDWVAQTYRYPDTIALPAIGISLVMAEVYAGLTLPSDEED